VKNTSDRKRVGVNGLRGFQLSLGKQKIRKEEAVILRLGCVMSRENLRGKVSI
jgi:hypothetical protein